MILVHGARRGRTVATVLASVGLLAGTVSFAGASVAQAATVGATSGSIAVNGSGFGHGVGLSQYGAYGQAKANPALTGAQIARYYYTGTTVATFTDQVPLKVDIAHGVSSLALRSTSLGTGGGGFSVVVPGTPARAVPPGGYVTVGLSGGGLVLVQRDSAGTAVAGGTLRGSAATITWAQRPTTLGVTIPGRTRQYRWGSLQLVPRSPGVEGLLTVDLHSEYLKGVAEMPSSWPAGALQAQVIAARTYALRAYRVGLRSDCGCHVFDSTVSQVYTGWAKESQPTYGARWVAAVAATQTSSSTGQTVLYGGVPIDAVFFSSSGGRTRNNEDVWGGSPLPYARSVADPWSTDAGINATFASWTRSLPVTSLLSVFGLTDLTSITVSSRDSGGAAKTVTAVGSNGTSSTVSGERFRSAFGLPASWIRSFGAVPLSFPVPAGMSPVYWSPGERTVNGRQWRTTCEAYSTGARCFTSIWATQYVWTGTTYVPKTGWVRNSISYFDHDSAAWTGNLYVTPGTRVVNGRTWRTTCSPNASSGVRICRTELWGTLVSRTLRADGTYRYFTYPGWGFIAFAYLQ